MPYFIRSLHIVLQDCTTAEIDDCLQPLILEMTTTQPHPLAAVTMFGFLAILEDVNLPYSPFHEKFDICSSRLHNYPNSCLDSAGDPRNDHSTATPSGGNEQQRSSNTCNVGKENYGQGKGERKVHKVCSYTP
jgi:hypothetical protein